MPYTYAAQYGPQTVLSRVGGGVVANPGVSVNVYLPGTTTKASLYTDRTKATAASNPVVADAGGNLTFFADPGRYDINFIPIGSGVATTLTVELQPDYAEPNPAPFGNATYAALVKPPTGITGSGSYDALRSVYNLNAGSFRKSRAKIAAAKAGSGLARIICAGTSMTTGYKATTTSDLSSYPVQMRDLIKARGYPLGGTGMVQPNTWNVSDADGRWAKSGVSGGDWGTGGVSLYSSGALSTTVNGAMLTFTSDIAGTAIDLLYYSANGPFTVTIDGGAPVTITPPGGASNTTYTVTGLANTTHTVKVTTTSTTQVFILACQVRGASGIMVTNAGVDSSTSTSFADNNFYEWGLVTTTAPYSPDLYLFSGPMNDVLQGVATATTTSNLQTVLNRAKSAGADVALIVEPATTTVNASDALWDTYRQICYGAADAVGCPLIDLTDALGRRTTVVANGLDADGTHMNNAGYAAMAMAVFQGLGVF